MMNTTATYTTNNQTRTLLNDDELLQVVGGLPKPDWVGDCVYDNRYHLDMNAVYYAAIPNEVSYYIAKVLLLKVYEEDVCNWFGLYQQTRTLCVYMDENGNEHTAPIGDIFYVK